MAWDAKQKSKDNRLRHTYGISLTEWYALQKHQEGRCAICGKTELPLSVDHKHQPKEKVLRRKKEQWKIRPLVRGLLCWPCNAAIAKFRDNPVLMRSAADYIEHPPAKEVIKTKDEDANILQ